MDQTVGASDRTVRIVLGAVLAVVGIAEFANVLSLGTAIGAVALVVGLVLFVTGYLRICPAYSILGTDTLGR
ncbi:MAG: DUF2892 domain-containing protein [Halobacteriales archaeon]